MILSSDSDACDCDSTLALKRKADIFGTVMTFQFTSDRVTFMMKYVKKLTASHRIMVRNKAVFCLLEAVIYKRLQKYDVVITSSAAISI